MFLTRTSDNLLNSASLPAGLLFAIKTERYLICDDSHSNTVLTRSLGTLVSSLWPSRKSKFTDFHSSSSSDSVRPQGTDVEKMQTPALLDVVDSSAVVW